MKAKGITTRERVIERAYDLARIVGLEGLTIGRIAETAGMSKSGIFAHFRSREDMQLAVLDAAATKFFDAIMPTAVRAERGLLRIRDIMEGWFNCLHEAGPGCLLMAAVSEYDDRHGSQHDRLMQFEARWRSELEKSVDIAIAAGELPSETDVAPVVYELYGLALVLNHHAALDGYQSARRRADVSLSRLLQCLRTG